MKWIIGGIALLVLLIALVPLTAHGQQGCAVLTQEGYAGDQDCDNVPDFLDNCAMQPNADQRDINRNRVGDACDMLITEIIVRPDNHLRQGDFAHLTVRILNNRGARLQDITINVRSRDLGIDAIDRVEFVPSGETAAIDFWVKVPKCAAAKSYPLTITASMKDEAGTASTETQAETIYVEQGDACKRQAGSLDDTIITVFGQVTVDRGADAIIPVKIVNLGESQATYDMSLQDIDRFGSWRIDPAPRMTLSAGSSSTANLYIQTEGTAQPGYRDLTLTVTSGNQKTNIPVQLYVRAPASRGPTPLAVILQLLFIIILIALIIAALIIAMRRNGGKGPADGPKTDDGAPRREVTTEKTTERTIERKRTGERKTVAVEEAQEQQMETYY